MQTIGIITSILNRLNLTILSFLVFILFSTCGDHTKQVSPINKQAGFALTFDDDSIEEWYSLRQLLDKYDTKATFFVTNFDLLNEHQLQLLKELQTAGHEIGLHGLRHEIANNFLKHHSFDEYINAEVIHPLNLMRSEGFNPTSYAYPEGSRNKTLDDKLLETFKILRGVTETQRHSITANIAAIDEVYFQFDGTKLVKGLGIDNHLKISTSDIKQGLERAAAQKEVIIFYAHCPSDNNAEYKININYLTEILKMTTDLKLQSFTISGLVQ